MSETENCDSSPKISILIPVYNVEKYVARCLRSLFVNTIIADCEVIIVDDCSPDGSMKVVADVLEEFPAFAKNVVLRSHDCNRGLAAARNPALLQAHGKYIICVDSDDWVEPDYLEKLYAAAEKDNADVAMCDLYRETKKRSHLFEEISKSQNYVMELLAGELRGWLPEKLIRHSLLREHHIEWIEGLNMCEDLLIMTKVFFYAKKVVRVPEPLYHYDCTNQDSLSFRLNENKTAQLKRVVAEIESFLPAEYCNAVKQLKCRIKVWILKCKEHLTVDDIEMYNEEHLSKIEGLSLFHRLFFFLCEKRAFMLVHLITAVKR